MVFKRILFFLFGIIGVLVIVSSVPILKAELTQNSVNINNQYCCPNKKFLYVILLKDRKVTIDDHYRLIIKLIFPKDGKIVNKTEGTICKVDITTPVLIKTKTDSIDIMTYGEKLHGYMGVWTKNDCYYVDKNGSIDICTK